MTVEPDRKDFYQRDAQIAATLNAGTCADPFAVLGPHAVGEETVVRAYLPGAHAVELCVGNERVPMRPVDGLFVAPLPSSTGRKYRLSVHWPNATHITDDPYAFGPVLSEYDLYLFSEGTLGKLAERMGANVMTLDGVSGVHFAVWAPNARRVSIVGDFNSWDGCRHPMRRRHSAGVWEIFIPGPTEGERYKFEIAGADGHLHTKADPLAKKTEQPPATASVVGSPQRFAWTDAEWMAQRAARQAPQAPMSTYEVHAGSWMRPVEGSRHTVDWRDLAERLIPYAKGLGFTHIELLPIMEHPFGGSWGYQPLSQFAPSARYGAPEDFALFVDRCHRADLGVILDWVPAHFPTDAHGLARFDGTALYEHADPREGFHRDWNTLIYNLGRREVQGFLIASALWWLEHFHVDGLRVDAVASMLYRDYSRPQGEWIPNRFGGRENLESIDFLHRLNRTVHERVPGAITIAEESTAWPGVSAPVEQGGLGFSYKWNMGWMHDTLSYVSRDPLYRSWHHSEMTFGLIYAFSERFVLPLSHDEVVHGKGSLYGRIPGDPWQKLATLRAYFSFMWTHPGKKLLFMGGEIGQPREWDHDGEIDWGLLQDPLHAGLQKLVADLNALYARLPALHASDADPRGFHWIVGNDAANCVFAYERLAEGAPPVVVVLNMTPLPRYGYRIGMPRGGPWREVLNSDAAYYGGSNLGNAGCVHASETASHGRSHSVSLTLPPLGALVLSPEG